MSTKKQADKLIETLKNGQFHAECSNCGSAFLLKKAELFYEEEFTPSALKIYENRLLEIKKSREELKRLKKEIPERSQRTTKATNLGFIYERIAPTLEGFKFDPNDCRSIFDPIDYVIFNGLNKSGKVDSIVFMDVKSGEARLSGRQREIKVLVEEGKIDFQIY